MSRLVLYGLLTTLLLLPSNTRSNPSNAYDQMTRAERRLVLRYFWQVPSVYRAAELARAESLARYPQLSGQDDQRDAHRHSTWNGSMTRRLKSVRAAERWANAHEEIPNNPVSRKAMDLFNNRVGRDEVWAARTTTRVWWFRRTRFPSDGRIAQMMQDAVDRGDLRMVEEVGGRRDPQTGRLVPTHTP